MRTRLLRIPLAAVSLALIASAAWGFMACHRQDPMPDSSRLPDSLSRAILTPATADPLPTDTLVTDSTHQDSTATDPLLSSHTLPTSPTPTP